MDIFDKELLELFTAFHERGLRYMLVGGFATNLYGYQRTTGDIDIWIEDTLANRKALRQALADISLGDLPEIETVPFIAGYTTISLDSGFTLDIMSEIKGFAAGDFEACYQMAATHSVHDIPVSFLHLNHLIQAKQASGKPKDLIDIEELERIRNRQKGRE